MQRRSGDTRMISAPQPGGTPFISLAWRCPVDVSCASRNRAGVASISASVAIFAMDSPWRTRYTVFMKISDSAYFMMVASNRPMSSKQRRDVNAAPGGVRWMEGMGWVETEAEYFKLCTWYLQL